MAPHQPTGYIDPKDKDYLPIDPIYLSPQEEQALMNDVSRELGSYRADDLKRFYSELTSYDPNLSGFTHHTYIALVAMRNNVSHFRMITSFKTKTKNILVVILELGIMKLMLLNLYVFQNTIFKIVALDLN